MENKIAMNPDGYIEVTFVGHQTDESFNSVYEHVLPLMSTLKKDKKPLLGLFDMTLQTGFSLNSDKAALELLERVEYDRIAMYHVHHAEVTKGIILAIGKANNTKLFDNRESALEWLLS